MKKPKTERRERNGGRWAEDRGLLPAIASTNSSLLTETPTLLVSELGTGPLFGLRQEPIRDAIQRAYSSLQLRCNPAWL